MKYDQAAKAYANMLNESQHPMIEVDGVLKHRHNSLGQPIHHTDEGIRNFHRWFGDSTMIDEHGRPRVFYHSTLEDKEQFDSHGLFMGHTGTSGISVTDSPEMASRYLDRYAEFGWIKGVPNQSFHKNIIPVYVRASNPLHQDKVPTNIPLGYPLPKNYVSPVVKMGHDALVRDDAISRKGAVKHSTAKNAIRGKEVVLFDPYQVKSALGNVGSFSHPTKITESEEDYRGSHTAHGPDYGAPAHDLTAGAYPEDFYKSSGYRLYGDCRDDDYKVHSGNQHPMIEVDGVMHHRHNSLGQPIHHTDEGIKNFHRWFGNSSTVDEHGRPLVVYHGTVADFQSFDNLKTGLNDRGLWGKGHYFSTNTENANSYALRQGDGAHVLPTYVSVKNPLILKTGKDLITRLPNGTNYRDLLGNNLDGSKIKSIAQAGNHDGVIQIKPDGKIGDLVAYDSSQIKSATGNIGTFSHPSKITESRDSIIEAYHVMRVHND